MKTFEKTLRGLLHEVNDNVATFYILDSGIAPKTHEFLNTYFRGQNRTVTSAKFKAKVLSSTTAHLDKARLVSVPLTDLINQPVEMLVNIKHYSFSRNGKHISGWTIHIVEAHPF